MAAPGSYTTRSTSVRYGVYVSVVLADDTWSDYGLLHGQTDDGLYGTKAEADSVAQAWVDSYETDTTRQAVAEVVSISDANLGKKTSPTA